MAEYVCTQLSNPNLITGQRTCQAWAEQQPQTVLPALTYSDANLIIAAYAVLLASIWGFRRVLAIFR